MAKLIANVNLGGRWYGPAYPDTEVPPEVGEQLDNPDLWQDGVLPGQEPTEQISERKHLEARARDLGIKVHGNEKDETIRRKVQEAEAEA